MLCARNSSYNHHRSFTRKDFLRTTRLSHFGKKSSAPLDSFQRNCLEQSQRKRSMTTEWHNQRLCGTLISAHSKPSHHIARNRSMNSRMDHFGKPRVFVFLFNTFMAQIRGRRLLLTRSFPFIWMAFQRPQIYGQAKSLHPNQRLPVIRQAIEAIGCSEVTGNVLTGRGPGTYEYTYTYYHIPYFGVNTHPLSSYFRVPRVCKVLTHSRVDKTNEVHFSVHMFWHGSWSTPGNEVNILSISEQ